MKILFLASEASPLARTGGLADVAGALPRALRSLGHDVRLVLPAYRSVLAQITPRATGIQVSTDHAGQVSRGEIWQHELHGVPLYLIDVPHYYDRDGLYGTSLGDYPDNAERFGFFCRAALAMLPGLDFRPDVIHCNDWQTGLVPVLLRSELWDDPFFSGCGVLFTIHNLGYQGLFPYTALAPLGIEPELFHPEALEFWGRLSFLKGGVVYADRVNTVSPTYCRETCGPELGLGFDGILRGRGSRYSGILNGIDQQQWNPAADEALAHPFDSRQLEGKAFCKRALQRELGLKEDDGPALVAMVTRLDTQKGLDLVERAWPELLRRELQLVILGTGEERHAAFLAGVRNHHPGQVAVRLAFDDALSRRIFAGSDLFLMPSRYEPCGLGQLIALRYGSVPVVRATGGLADTIVDPQDDPATANGFSFRDLSPWAMLHALDRALACRQRPDAWRNLRRRGMEQDFSWENSAQHYLDLYHACREGHHE